MQKIQEQDAQKAQSKVILHAKIHAKKSTLLICAKAQNSRMHPPKQTWPVRVNDEKSPKSIFFLNKKIKKIDQSDS